MSSDGGEAALETSLDERIISHHMFQTALQVNTLSPECWANLASSFSILGQSDNAVVCYDQVNEALHLAEKL